MIKAECHLSTNKHHLNSHSDKHTLEAAASHLRRCARRPRDGVMMCDNEGIAEVGRARRLEVGVSEVEAGQGREVRDGGEKHASP